MSGCPRQLDGDVEFADRNLAIGLRLEPQAGHLGRGGQVHRGKSVDAHLDAECGVAFDHLHRNVAGAIRSSRNICDHCQARGQPVDRCRGCAHRGVVGDLGGPLELRQQLGLIARQAWLLGRGIQPLLSFSEGRTFRLAVQLRRHLQPGEEHQLGLIARCERCGAQRVQPMLKLTGWPPCSCTDGQGRWSVSGPLWIGPLQDEVTIEALQTDSALKQRGQIAGSTSRLLQRLAADPGIPPTVWPTAELAKRLGGGGPPRLDDLVQALRCKGHRAYASGVMAGQVRTDALLPELLQTCSEQRGEGP